MSEAGLKNVSNRTGRGKEALALDLVCFSHLRWDYIFQRPQHLMSRWAQGRRVFYVEEPAFDLDAMRLEVREDDSGVLVVIPQLPRKITTSEDYLQASQALIDQLIEDYQIQDYLAWYYSPMAVGYSRHLKPELVVYDCMDELSAFKGAPQRMKDYEAELLSRAGVVFTGGRSLYEAKSKRHSNVHAFPSSIDREHFARARTGAQQDPADQAGIPHPRLGYYGAIDERMGFELVQGIAEARPDWHLVLIGPVTKIDPDELPRAENIHFLGKKEYAALPAYLAGWDVAIMPFVLNETTRFISPTKTPEYLAGGKPVVSTPIRDIVRPYGEQGLVWIADSVAKFVLAVESALVLNGNKDNWLRQVDDFLAGFSWDDSWMGMNRLIEAALEKNRSPVIVKLKSEGPLHSDAPVSLPTVPPAKATFRPANGDRNGRSKGFDVLIVGAGFAGSVLAERLACGSGKKVLLIDRRNHIGGNAYDHFDENGLLVHKYGPHIFHTNSKEVFTYLSRFTRWRPYEHRVLASVDGQLLPIPINLDTVNRLYGLHLSSFDLEKYFESVAEPKEKIATSEDVVVNKIGRQLYEKFFRNYTRKQWGLDPSELDAAVTSRVPVRLNRDDRYFSDIYQSMPAQGFTRMFENMLDHANIKIMLNTDFRDLKGLVQYRKVVYTGPVDEYFDFCYGKLPYRSLQFKFETLNKDWQQPVAVINYPNEHAYTRVTEFKHLTGQEHAKTSLVYEYPCSEGDPYYPIPRPENAEIYKKYRELAETIPGVHFAGRLATYKYYNMDQVTAQALTQYTRIAGLRRSESIAAYTPGRFSIEMPCSLLVDHEAGY